MTLEVGTPSQDSPRLVARHTAGHKIFLQKDSDLYRHRANPHHKNLSFFWKTVSIMSKITVAGVRTNVQSLLDYSTNEKKRNFLETVELQVRHLHL